MKVKIAGFHGAVSNDGVPSMRVPVYTNENDELCDFRKGRFFTEHVPVALAQGYYTKLTGTKKLKMGGIVLAVDAICIEIAGEPDSKHFTKVKAPGISKFSFYYGTELKGKQYITRFAKKLCGVLPSIDRKQLGSYAIRLWNSSSDAKTSRLACAYLSLVDHDLAIALLDINKQRHSSSNV